MGERVSYSVPVEVHALPPKGRVLRIVADDADRATLASELGLHGIDTLTAELTLAPHGGDGVRVDGHIAADVLQACVVTLEPVPARVETAVETLFAPPGSALLGGELPVEIEVEMDSADPAEPFDGRTIDVGAVIAEFLGLALDPYPRLADAELPAEARDGGASPFAALAALKTDG